MRPACAAGAQTAAAMTTRRSRFSVAAVATVPFRSVELSDCALPNRGQQSPRRVMPIPEPRGYSVMGSTHPFRMPIEVYGLASVEITAAAPTSTLPDELGVELVRRTRQRRKIVGVNEVLAYGLCGGFLTAAVATALFLPTLRPFSLVTAAVTVAAYAVVSRVEFEVGSGAVHAGELVLVPMF